MTDSDKVAELVRTVRKSDAAKGRTYSGTGVEPKWLATEIAEYCRSQGWENSLNAVPDGNGWLIESDFIAALVEGSGDEVHVRVLDDNPVRLKSALFFNRLLALTGAGAVALPMAGIAAWRSQARQAKVDSILAFVDQRIQARSENPSSGRPLASVADRLRDLARLRDQGLVTEDEYLAKRTELMRAL